MHRFGLKATINTSACHYLIHIGTPVGRNHWDGDIDVECGSGAIVTSTLTCELKVDTQSGLSELTGTNAGGSGPTEMAIELHAAVEGITYTVTKDGVGCPLTKVGTLTEGDYFGSITVTAHNELEEPVGLTIK